ncbi:T9SS type B sorting domain-containing protein [Alkaliflexus imshenetskii]|uniref:T9SS type B sorting domain-containing protein n=1 Tax=Alkaliflexus imshenetskii TaxID=286730 RepID=UPI0004BA1697|nr:gliding motility-associated C-terminal domain-containing protein [Alkaliflexus imshenetskii]
MVSVTDGNGCQSVLNIPLTLTVNPLPTIDNLVNNSSTPLCVGSTIRLDATATGFGSNYVYRWYFNNLVTPVYEGPNAFYEIASATLANSGTYGVQVRDEKGCWSSIETLPITVNANPIPTLAFDGAQLLCAGSSVSFVAGGGDRYVFFVDNVELQDDSSPNFSHVFGAGTHTVRVVVYDGIGCSAETSMTFTVNALPLGTIHHATASDAEVCIGESATLEIRGLTGSANWTVVYNTNPGGYVTLPPIATSPYSFVVSPLANTTYSIVSITDGNGCVNNSISSSVSVDVNPLPTIDNLVNNSSTPLCVGSTIRLDATATGFGSNYVYRWYFDNLVTPVYEGPNAFYEIANVTLANSGTYGVQVRDEKGCWSSIETLPITVNANPIPTLAFDGAQLLCAGSSVSFVAGGGDRYVFFVDNVELQDDSSPNFSHVFGAGTHTVRVVVFDGIGCSAETSMTFTVNALPLGTIHHATASDAEVCIGESATLEIRGLTGSANWTVVYNTNPGGYVTLPPIATSPYSFVVSPLANTTYSIVSITDGNGCVNNSISSSVSVDVNPLPTIDNLVNNSSTPLCVGSTIRLDATATGFGSNYVYRWYFDNLVTPVYEGPNAFYEIASATLANSGTYGVQVRDEKGCWSSIETLPITVNANPIPTLAFDGAQLLCAGSSVSFVAGGGNRYVFFVDNVELQDDSSPNFSHVFGAGIHTVRVVVYDGIGCSAETSMTFTVNALPLGTIHHATASDAEVCIGESATLEIRGLTGSANWTVVYNTNPGGDVTLPPIATSPYSFVVSPLANTTYSIVSITDGNGCVNNSISSSVSVDVNPLPTIDNLVNNSSTPLCVGSTIRLDATATGFGSNYVYRWYFDNLVTPVYEGPNAFYEIASATLANSGTYGVQVRDEKGCWSSIETLPITVNANPVLTLQLADPSASICADTDVSFTATGADDYAFYLDGSAVPVQGPSTDASITLNLPAGSYSLRVVGSVATGCVGETNLNFTVLPIPEPVLNVTYDTPCVGQIYTFTALPAGYATYIFTINGIIYNNGANNVLQLSTLVADAYTATVTVGDGSCQGISDAVSFEVNPIPSVVLLLVDATQATVCINEDVEFVASGADEYQFIVNGVPVGTRSAVNTFTYASADNFSVSVIGYSEFECSMQTPSVNVVISKPVAGISSVVTTDVSKNINSICVNDEVEFTATGGTSYEFFYNNVSQGVSANAQFVVNNPVDGDEVYVRVIDAFGCEDISSTLTLTVYDLPVVQIDIIEGNDVICDGTLVTFQGTGGDSFAFYIIRGGVTSLVQAESALDTYSTSTLQDGDQVFVVARDNNSCLGTSASIAVTVNPNPVVTLTFNVEPPHISNESTLIATAGGGVEYIFLLNGNPVAGGWDDWATNNVYDYSGLNDGDRMGVIARNVFNCTATIERVVSVDPIPLQYELRPEESFYCEGEPGVQLYLTGYETDVTYLLFSTSDLTTPIATGVLDGGFIVWNNVTSGTYQAKAVRTPGISEAWMIGTANVQMLPAPEVFDFTDGEFFTCPSPELILSNSTVGINYYLRLNGNVLVGPTPGTGSSISFGTRSIAGEYSVLAVNPLTGCSSIMNGSTRINATPNSTIYNLFSDPADGRFCDGSVGVTLYLDGSDNFAGYELYRNGEPLTPSVVEIGDGGQLEFGTFNVEGYYNVMVAATGGCLYPMNNIIHLQSVNPPVAISVEADNDGSFCPNEGGVEIWLAGQEANVRYTLSYEGTDLISVTSGSITDLALPLLFPGTYNQAGLYTVKGTFINLDCEVVIGTINLTAEELPMTYVLTGDDGFCEGGGFASILLPESEVGVLYELYIDGTPYGANFTGNGGHHVFSVNQEGNYSVVATKTHSNVACSVTMPYGQVTEKPLPDLTKNVVVDLAGADCENGAGIILLASEPGVVYTIWWTDASSGTQGSTGITITGDGTDLTFPEGIIDNNGVYRVYAELDGCGDFLDEAFTVNVPNVIRKYAILGDGNFCQGDIGGIVISLSNSQADVTYQLYRVNAAGDIVNYGNPVQSIVVANDGDAVIFDELMQEGDYIVLASNVDCTDIPMHGKIVFRYYPLPVAFRLTGSGNYCDVTLGAEIGLDGSENNVEYRLMYHEDDIKVLRDIQIGNGFPILFNGQFTEGDYTVYARNIITGCTSSMNGLVTVERLNEPDTNVTITIADSDICPDDNTVITLESTEPGVDYHLYHEGIEIQWLTAVGTSLTFTGINLNGDYTVAASRNGECRVDISGFVNLNVNDAPAAFTVSYSEDDVCGSDAFIQIDGVQSGVDYYIYTFDGTDWVRFDESRSDVMPNETTFRWDNEFFLDHPWLNGELIQIRGINNSLFICPRVSEMFFVQLKPAPASFTVTDHTGTIVLAQDELRYCNTSVSIQNAQNNIIYRLLRNGTRIATIEGDGSNIEFPVQLTDGDYQIVATSIVSGCSSLPFEFSVSLLPEAHPGLQLSNVGGDCLSFDVVYVFNPIANVDYILYRNGEALTDVAGELNETLNRLEWLVTHSGTYHVKAEIQNFENDCQNNISSAISVNLHSGLSAINLKDNIYELDYCSEDEGVNIVVENTVSGVYYELYSESRGTIQILRSTGTDVVFANMRNSGNGDENYEIRVDSGSSCDVSLTLTFTITENKTPDGFHKVRGDGAIGASVIELTGSEVAVWYYLLQNGEIVYDKVAQFGTGSVLNFGSVSEPGHYHVLGVGEGGCWKVMDGFATMYQTNLVAVPDTLYLRPGDLIGFINLSENDTRLSFLPSMDILGENLEFQISTLNTSGEAMIDPLTGLLTYQKLPTFYGQDSLMYRVINTEATSRESNWAKVMIMVGNKDIGGSQSFLLPNAFSPNGDGINDRFEITGLGATEESSLEIFNRWGTIVYRSEGRRYNNDWDGTSNVGAMVSIGKELPNGVYFYIFEVKKNVEGKLVTKRYSGYVELRR